MKSVVSQVEVLLATYNGEHFLSEQIDSILSQDYDGLRVVARDDGSTDATRTLLEQYARRYPERFKLMPMDTPSGGAKWNFMRLLGQSSAQYVCFADQDDVWKADKVSSSMNRMSALEARHGKEMPLLVFSDLEVVKDQLDRINASFWGYQGIVPVNIHRFSRLLTQNVVTGCTALINRPLAELAMTMPAESYMHDWWIALMACAFGDADYIPEATVLYRQHGANVVGAVEHGKPNLVPRWRYHDMRRAQWEQSEKQAEALLRLHGARLPQEKVAILEDYVRCEESDNRWVRVFTVIRRGFFQVGLRPTLAILWYLFDMKAAKRSDRLRFGDDRVQGES